MRKLIMLAVIIACAALPAFAQNDDYNKVEGAVLFSHNRVDTGISDEDEDLDDIIDEREGFNGINASVTGNVSRYVGLKGDYAFHRKGFDESFGGVNIDVNSDLHTFVGGVQFKDNNRGEKAVKPFAHLMAGVAHARFSIDNAPAGFDFTESETGFAGVIGGGLDIRVNDDIDFRAIQFDYNPTRLGDATQHNFRIGIGIVFH
ncbi:MAG TPA: outer membrane beta-barrel protein [Pyrinomonadaceae bacterium]|nr:outer membrane beta-barrel protein [Pyrinomonadaceae bacterium]